MANFVEMGGLRVDPELYSLVRDEIAPGTGIQPEAFWRALSEIVTDLAPKNRWLLEKRNALQKRIDEWCLARRGQAIKLDEYKEFLFKIGYLVPEGGKFKVTTANVDPEITRIAGAQLVVPLDNARYALNAANARWGSLYDALYGTNVIPEEDGAEKGESYNPRRGAKVIAYTEDFLDKVVSLKRGSFSAVTRFFLRRVGGKKQLAATLKDASTVGLADARKFLGYQESNGELSAILLSNNESRIEIQIDRNHPIGKAHPAGVKDVVLEAAITTIEDCEDAVAAVDAADKIMVYRHWCGIMKGTLEATFDKNGRPLTRRLNPDKTFVTPAGGKLTLPGRSLLLVRNVGIHMYTDAVTTADGREIPEGFLDVMVTGLAAIHDLKGKGKFRNSMTKEHLYRQTQAPRAGRSRGHGGAVRTGGKGIGPEAKHAQDRHHGRGAAHDRQPQGVHKSGEGADCLYQHGFPGSDRRRNPYQYGVGRDAAEGRDQSSAVDQGL